jgi:hypothetical protein
LAGNGGKIAGNYGVIAPNGVVAAITISVEYHNSSGHAFRRCSVFTRFPAILPFRRRRRKEALIFQI